jgi:hypothetical protein
MGIFSDLLSYLEDWVESDSRYRENYLEWLFEKFGHKKSYIFENIIYNKIME